MKLSWSYKITILYLGFVGIIVTLVVISGNNKEELVSKDYYAQELKYQERIDAANNAGALTESIEHNIDKKNITLSIASGLMTGDLKGEVYFFCPSDSKKDQTFILDFNKDGKQILSTNKLRPAVYKMRLSWRSNNKNYFKENIVTIH